jgi:protein involved in polysaccharide export with SLBB domain
VISTVKNVKHLVLALSALSPVTAGCTSGSSRGLSPFPQAHRLADEAKQLRDANPPPLQVPRELDTRPLPAYTVEPGDVLLAHPADLDSPVRFPGEQPVLPDGTINLGKYGRLQVMGKSVPEIETLVRGAVQVHVKDAGFISVRLVARQSKVYYVIGEVNSPGAFQLQGRETVLDAILQAGGLAPNASRSNIILSRPTRPDCPRIVLPVCWTNIVQFGDTATNYQIAPGDRIYVPTRGTLETIPFLAKHAEKNLCCGPQTPYSLPPYLGAPCFEHPNPFQGSGPVSRTVEGPGPIGIPLLSAPTKGEQASQRYVTTP